MKKIIAAVVFGLAFCDVMAEEAYTLVNDPQGYSFIQINQDLDSFSFVSDFKSIGNGGSVGYFIYPAGLEGQELKDYIANFPADDAKFAKKVNDGRIDLGSLSAGDRVGFYEHKKGHGIVRGWDFQTMHDITYIAFDKNGGHGKDEWMSIENITTTGDAGGGSAAVARTLANSPSGAPLPGALAILLLGGAGFGALKLKRARAR